MQSGARREGPGGSPWRGTAPPDRIAFGPLADALGALAVGPLGAGPPLDVASFQLRDRSLIERWRHLAVEPPRPIGGASCESLVLRAEVAALAAAADGGDEVAAILRAAHRARFAPPGRVLIMGIVNATPDSFSDEGRHAAPEAAIAHGLALVAEGADLLDVGGESTRPGALPVPAEIEAERVLPVLAGLAAAAGVPLSIDTTKASVARAAAASGAAIVNDVSAGTADPAMLATVAELGLDYVAMHRRGTPLDMQVAPNYGDATLEVANELRRRVRACLDAGIPLERVTLDPGLGFGKRVEDNLALLRRTGDLRSLGLPLLVGASRKSFIARVVAADEEASAGAARPVSPPAERIGGTAAASTFAVLGGARVLRVHDVRKMVEATRVAEALARASIPTP